MATRHMETPGSTTTSVTPRRRFVISSVAVRLLIALAISWLIVMAFFVTRVASH